MPIWILLKMNVADGFQKFLISAVGEFQSFDFGSPQSVAHMWTCAQIEPCTVIWGGGLNLKRKGFKLKQINNY